MFERYSEQSRRVIFFARHEASRYGSRYIETEHLLLGIVREKPRVLETRFPQKWIPRGSSAGKHIRSEIEKHITPGERIPTSVEVPLSEECRKIMKLAADLADNLQHRMIEPEHLLLGILGVEKCLAAQILSVQGIKAQDVEDELARGTFPKKEPTPAILSLNHFLEAINSSSMDDLMHFFADVAEVIDASGRRLARNEIADSQYLFSLYAKKNATYFVEDAITETGGLFIASVIWNNALLASQERSWIHRMTVTFVQDANASWQVLFLQVTPIQPFSTASE